MVIYATNQAGEQLRIRVSPYVRVAVDLANGYCKSGWEENVETFEAESLSAFLRKLQSEGGVSFRYVHQ